MFFENKPYFLLDWKCLYWPFLWKVVLLSIQFHVIIFFLCCKYIFPRFLFSCWEINSRSNYCSLVGNLLFSVAVLKIFFDDGVLEFLLGFIWVRCFFFFLIILGFLWLPEFTDWLFWKVLIILIFFSFSGKVCFIIIIHWGIIDIHY